MRYHRTEGPVYHGVCLARELPVRRRSRLGRLLLVVLGGGAALYLAAHLWVAL